jgi:hypothetical protein
LCGLIATAQQKKNGPAGLLEVDAVTRTMGHSHLANARPDRFDVTGIAKAEPLDTGNNFRLGLLIRKT